jgi:hypothetical protein
MRFQHVISVGIFCMAWTPAGAAAQDRILLREGFENDLDRKVWVADSNQPYDAKEIGITTAAAHGGRRSLKVDVEYLHGLSVYAAPRTVDPPRAEYGAIGGQGTFVLPGLKIPLRPDRGYLLRAWVNVVRASEHNPVRLSVITASDSDYGVVRTETSLGPEISRPTDGWVRIEQELATSVIEPMEAGGSQVEGLRLEAITVGSFANRRLRMTVLVDDLELEEVGLQVVEEHRRRQTASQKSRQRPFRRTRSVEDTFVWGVYGSLTAPAADWLLRLDRGNGQAAARAEQARRVREYGDWVLLRQGPGRRAGRAGPAGAGIWRLGPTGSPPALLQRARSGRRHALCHRGRRGI